MEGAFFIGRLGGDGVASQMVRLSQDDSEQTAAVKVSSATANHSSADDTRESHHCRLHFSHLKKLETLFIKHHFQL